MAKDNSESPLEHQRRQEQQRFASPWPNQEKQLKLMSKQKGLTYAHTGKTVSWVKIPRRSNRKERKIYQMPPSFSFRWPVSRLLRADRKTYSHTCHFEKSKPVPWVKQSKLFSPEFSQMKISITTVMYLGTRPY